MIWKYRLADGDCSKCCLFKEKRVKEREVLLSICGKDLLMRNFPNHPPPKPFPWKDWDSDPCFASFDSEREVAAFRREARKQIGSCGGGKCYARTPADRCEKTIDLESWLLVLSLKK